MGKLSDLWADRKATSDPDKRKEIEAKINKIEKWCIENGFGGIKEVTDWTKQSTKKTYRGEAVRHHGYNPPTNARFGKDMCQACVYNKRAYCNPDDEWGHMANV